MSDAWINWTLAACALPGAHGAPGRATFAGEGDGVVGFANSRYDLAYTAGGYDPAIKFLGSTDPHRAAVAVPIALNAAVIGVAGGRHVGTHKVPYKDIKVTPAESAVMISGGSAGVAQKSPSGSGTYGDDIKARNPELASTDLFDSAAGFAVGAYSDAEVFSWYGTRFFTTLAPQAWKVPNAPAFGSDAGHARGIDAALAIANPGFNPQYVNLLTGRPALRKGLLGLGTNTSGGVWVLSDMETATALNLIPAQLQNADGTFVAPNADTMRAALPGMKADEQGILISDPKKGSANAYPMTFVEYALVPAEPLVNADCSPRGDSQKLLTNWLTYVTGDGQAKLPAGMVALPDNLRKEAADAIKKVGTTASGCASGAAVQPPAIGGGGGPAGSAAPPLAIPPPESAASPAVGSPLPGIGASGLPADSGVGSDASALPSDATSPGAAEHGARQLAAAIPAFAGRRSAGWGSSAFALLGVIALSSLALVVTARTR
jgi:hypothetical protein